MLLSFPREDLGSADITNYLIATRNVARLVEEYRFEDMDLLGRLAATDVEVARYKTDQLIELLLGGEGSRSQKVHEFIEKIGDPQVHPENQTLKCSVPENQWESINLPISALISSLIILVFSRFSSSVPVSDDGSSNDQCSVFKAPGKIGHRSELAASQTVTT